MADLVIHVYEWEVYKLCGFKMKLWFELVSYQPTNLLWKAEALEAGEISYCLMK